MEELLLEQCNGTFENYLKLVVILFILSMNFEDPLLLRWIGEQYYNAKLDAELFVTMTKTLSATRKEINYLHSQLKSADPKMMIYDFNPLRKKPIVLENEIMYLPVPQFLFSAITKGFYHTLCDRIPKFREKFGKLVFEKYVQHVLRWKTPDYEIIPEFEYYIGRDRLDSPDCILVKDNNVILLEVKATAPSIQLSATDIENYENQMTKAYGVAISQCIKNEEHIRKGKLRHAKLPHQIDHFFYVVVTLEAFYAFERKIIEDAVAEKGCMLAKNKCYHLMDVATLEDIVENDTRSFFDYICERELEERVFSSFPGTDTNKKNPFRERRSVKYVSSIIDEIVGSMRK